VRVLVHPGNPDDREHLVAIDGYVDPVEPAKRQANLDDGGWTWRGGKGRETISRSIAM
jgi:hypothetical protein